MRRNLLSRFVSRHRERTDRHPPELLVQPIETGLRVENCCVRGRISPNMRGRSGDNRRPVTSLPQGHRGDDVPESVYLQPAPVAASVRPDRSAIAEQRSVLQQHEMRRMEQRVDELIRGFEPRPLSVNRGDDLVADALRYRIFSVVPVNSRHRATQPPNGFTAGPPTASVAPERGTASSAPCDSRRPNACRRTPRRHAAHAASQASATAVERRSEFCIDRASRSR